MAFYERTWFQVCTGAYGIYALWIIFYVISRVVRMNRLQRLDAETFKKYQPFIPQYVTAGVTLEMVLGGIFLLPVRMVLSSITMCTTMILLRVAFLCTDLEKPLPPCLERFLGCVLSACCTLMPLINGLFSSYKEVDPEQYASLRSHRNACAIDSSTPLKFNQLLSNHTTLFDVFICYKGQRVSFVGKSSIKKEIFFGAIAQIGQCVFVDRQNKESKSMAFQSIKNRIKEVKEGKRVPPLVIFPEGTRCSHQIMSAFMAGGFIETSCVKLQANKYRFTPNDLVGELLPYCLFYNHVSVTTCVVSDKYFSFESGDAFKKATQAWMTEVLDIGCSESNIRDSFEFSKLIKDKAWLKAHLRGTSASRGDYTELNEKKSE